MGGLTFNGLQVTGEKKIKSNVFFGKNFSNLIKYKLPLLVSGYFGHGANGSGQDSAISYSGQGGG
jgi:hypothetical protein